MRRRTGRIALGGMAVVLVVAVLAGGGAAGNRTADVSLQATPGPALVTWGKNIAYRATFRNTSGSMFTHVAFKMAPPVDNLGQKATFVTSSANCVVTVAPSGEISCPFGQQPPASSTDPQVSLIVVWKTPSGGTTLTAQARWTAKEGVNDQTDPNDTFLTQSVTATLLATPDLTRAGGYQLPRTSYTPGSCTDPNLETNQVVSLANPLSSRICLPLFTGTPTDPGLVATITEGPNTGAVGGPHQSEICVPTFGQDCTTNTYTPYPFASAPATFVFRVQLEPGDKLEIVYHDWVAVPLGCPSAGDCVQSITVDPKTKIWTVVVQARSNGSWTFD